MKIFSVYKGKLKVEVEKEYPEMATFRKHPLYLEAWKFIFYYYDLVDNPLKHLPYNELADEATKLCCGFSAYDEEGLMDYFGEDFFAVIQKTGEHIYDNTPNKYFEYYAFDKKLDQLKKMLTELRPMIVKNENDKTGDINYTTNITIINKTLANIIKIIQTKKKLEVLYADSEMPDSLRGNLDMNTQKTLLHKL